MVLPHLFSEQNSAVVSLFIHMPHCLLQMVDPPYSSQTLFCIYASMMVFLTQYTVFKTQLLAAQTLSSLLEQLGHTVNLSFYNPDRALVFV